MSATSRTRYHQNHTGRECGATGHRMNWNGLLFRLSGFDRADIEYFFRLRVGDAFRHKNEYTEDNEKDADNRDRFHTHETA